MLPQVNCQAEMDATNATISLADRLVGGLASVASALHEGADKDAARGRTPGGQRHILPRLLHQALQGGAFGQAVAATLKKG